MNWKQRNVGYRTISEVITGRSGLTEDELLNPKETTPDTIQNLTEAADAIRNAIAEEKAISVMGDYDADGITSSSILYFLLTKMGAEPHIRLPRRMSEGYGLAIETVKEFAPGLLITVDNGISANEAIQAAKDKGMAVIVLDHHLPGEALPCADVIVDPHIAPEENGFVDYCGAGLAYKLAQLIFPEDNKFLAAMEVLACIGTIADSMPLVGDNRVIVKHGLATMRAGNHLIPGVRAIIRAAEIYGLDESSIGFKVAPMLNAAGRMRDDGAMLSFQTLTAKRNTDADNFADELKTINEERKEATNTAAVYVDGLIHEYGLQYDAPICVIADDVPEGIVGILTGRIAEQYKTPTFILTTCETPGLLKGSGRSYGDYNLMEVVDAIRPFLVSGGGHTGAAGITIEEKDYEEVIRLMQEAMTGYEPPEESTVEYDLEIPVEEIHKTYDEMQKYAPFGQGVPKPVVMVKDVVLSPRAGSLFKYMGRQSEHIKMHARNFSAICFGQAEKYRSIGCPANVDILGALSMNSFQYSSELQIEAEDFREHSAPTPKRASSLMEALRLNGTI